MDMGMECSTLQIGGNFKKIEKIGIEHVYENLVH